MYLIGFVELLQCLEFMRFIFRFQNTTAHNTKKYKSKVKSFITCTKKLQISVILNKSDRNEENQFCTGQNLLDQPGRATIAFVLMKCTKGNYIQQLHKVHKSSRNLESKTWLNQYKQQGFTYSEKLSEV